MPPLSAKNAPLSAVGVDLGLQGGTPSQDAETEEERKKRLALAQRNNNSIAGPTGQAWVDLGLGQM